MLCHSDDDEQPIGRCLSFGCHVAMGGVEPGLCLCDYRNGSVALPTSQASDVECACAGETRGRQQPVLALIAIHGWWGRVAVVAVVVGGRRHW